MGARGRNWGERAEWSKVERTEWGWEDKMRVRGQNGGERAEWGWGGACLNEIAAEL